MLSSHAPPDSLPAEQVLELNPKKNGALRLEPTDQVVVLGDAF